MCLSASSSFCKAHRALALTLQGIPVSWQCAVLQLSTSPAPTTFPTFISYVLGVRRPARKCTVLVSGKAPSFWTAKKIVTSIPEETLQNLDVRIKMTSYDLPQSCIKPVQTEMKNEAGQSSLLPEFPLSSTQLPLTDQGTNQAHMPRYFLPYRSSLLHYRDLLLYYGTFFWETPSDLVILVGAVIPLDSGTDV